MRTSRQVVVVWAVMCGLSGCGEAIIADAGTDAGRRTDSGGGTDAGGRVDSGAGDAGGASDAGGNLDGALVDAASRTDAGPPVFQSEMTIYLGGLTPLTLRAVDDSGNPLAFTAGIPFDTPPGDGTEEVYMFVGDDIYTFSALDAPNAVFVRFGDSIDDTGAPIRPDTMAAGNLALAGGNVMFGTFGSTARSYAFGATPAFTVAVALTETGPIPFTPISVTTGDFGIGAGDSIIALKAGSNIAYLFNDAMLLFQPGAATVTCAGATINPNLILAGPIAGLAPPAGGTSTAVVVEGSSAFALQQVTPSVCFSNAIAIVNETGGSVTPSIAFGIDIEDDGDDDVVVIENVLVP